MRKKGFNNADGTWVTMNVNEGDSGTATGRVRYGADTAWIEKDVAGSFTCSNDYFGSDPAPFVKKHCEMQQAAAAPDPGSLPPVLTPAPASTILGIDSTYFFVGSALVVALGVGAFIYLRK